MISFVWPLNEAMLAGTGGSETFTAGHVRELKKRGIDTQIVIVGAEIEQSRKDFPDLPFLGLTNKQELCSLGGIIVFVNNAYDLLPRDNTVIILHCAVSSRSTQYVKKEHITDQICIATSVYNGQQWASHLNIPSNSVKLVMPFADPLYGKIRRSCIDNGQVNVLFAGRLHPEKGIYTILEMMHDDEIRTLDINMNIVMAGQHVEEGRVIARMLRDYEYANLIEPKKNVVSMASLLATTDILLMPSVYDEPFGMLSVEAQHCGCRVIASNVGGLSETNCGLLSLVKARDPKALIEAMREAIELGPPTEQERKIACSRFTLQQSVDSLLECVSYYCFT